jgi:hypothetical protein
VAESRLRLYVKEVVPVVHDGTKTGSATVTGARPLKHLTE